MAYIGACAAKALFAAGIEVFGSRIIVLGSGPFGRSCIAMLDAMGADVSHVAVNAPGGFADQLAEASRGADAIVIAEHHDPRPLIGGAGGLPPERLVHGTEAPSIVHICGTMDASRFEALGLNVYPSRPAPAGSMSLTTDFVGPKPLIDLHTAGLVVGASLTRRRIAGNTAEQAEQRTLHETPFAQAFPAASHVEPRAAC
jgi:threonine dehydrogenase-like Zn-dependent dehydrogenase